MSHVESLDALRSESSALKRRMYELAFQTLGGPKLIVLPEHGDWAPHSYVEGARWRRLCHEIRYARLALIEAPMGAESKLHYHEHGELIIVQSGTMNVWIDGVLHQLEEGVSISVPQLTPHRIVFTSSVRMFALWFPAVESEVIK